MRLLFGLPVSSLNANGRRNQAVAWVTKLRDRDAPDPARSTNRDTKSMDLPKTNGTVLSRKKERISSEARTEEKEL